MKQLLFALILTPGFLFAQVKEISHAEYIETYKDIAISEMKRTGIPASIKSSEAL